AAARADLGADVAVFPDPRAQRGGLSAMAERGLSSRNAGGDRGVFRARGRYYLAGAVAAWLSRCAVAWPGDDVDAAGADDARATAGRGGERPVRQIRRLAQTRRRHPRRGAGAGGLLSADRRLRPQQPTRVLPARYRDLPGWRGDPLSV